MENGKGQEASTTAQLDRPAGDLEDEKRRRDVTRPVEMLVLGDC
jgi:hypothetical protein